MEKKPKELLLIKRLDEQPEDLLDLFDYILTQLLLLGPGKVEPVWQKEDETHAWTYTSRINGNQKVLATTPDRNLRALFARFATLLDMNCYCGHMFFHVQHADAVEKENAGFSLFLCNEPTMEFWMKLYFYSIPGEWPFKYDK